MLTVPWCCESPRAADRRAAEPSCCGPPCCGPPCGRPQASRGLSSGCMRPTRLRTTVVRCALRPLPSFRSACATADVARAVRTCDASLAVSVQAKSSPSRSWVRRGWPATRASPGAGDRHAGRPRAVCLHAPNLELLPLVGELNPRHRGRSVLEQLDAEVADRRLVVHPHRLAECAAGVVRERDEGLALVLQRREPRRPRRRVRGR